LRHPTRKCRLLRYSVEPDLDVRSNEMKKHIGKLIGVAGILLMLLANIIGPHISRAFFIEQGLHEVRGFGDMANAMKGTALCIQLGLCILLIGTAIEVVQAFKGSKQKKANKVLDATSL
jgi:hypothetical protein